VHLAVEKQAGHELLLLYWIFKRKLENMIDLVRIHTPTDTALLYFSPMKSHAAALLT
jgi:hypothetical protein